MRILLAEDEKELSRALCAVLQHQGYETDAAYDGEEALELAFSRSYDCMVFDIMMPKLDGVTAVRSIRDSGIVTPVIMLTAKSEVDDRVEGLDAGADDYLTKPFAMKELMARLRSMTRRSKAFTPTRLSLGSVTLNTEEQELTGSNSIRLAKKESKLMEILLLNPGRSLSTRDLLTRVWSDEPDAEDGLVWIYISYLRQKLVSIGADIEIVGEKGQSFTVLKK